MKNDLISRSALRAVVGEDINRCYRLGIGSVGPLTHFLEQINSAPAVDAEPVRYGWWNRKGLYGDYKCSECGAGDFTARDFEIHPMLYCPVCGTRMNGCASDEQG